MVCISSSTPPSAATPTPTRSPFPSTPLFSSLLFFSISTPTPTPIPLFLSVPLTLRLFVVLTPGLFFGSLSCLLPFLNVFYRRIGLSESKIGVLSLVRPWASGAAALLSALVVDRFGRHGTLMLLGSVISLAARMSTLFGEGLAPGSAVQVALLSFLVLVTEMGSGPVFVIADAVTMGGANLPGGEEYGKQRLWGAVTYGVCALGSGAAVGIWGLHAAFLTHAVLAMLALVPTSQLDFYLLRADKGKGGPPPHVIHENENEDHTPHEDEDEAQEAQDTTAAAVRPTRPPRRTATSPRGGSTATTTATATATTTATATATATTLAPSPCHVGEDAPLTPWRRVSIEVGDDNPLASPRPASPARSVVLHHPDHHHHHHDKARVSLSPNHDDRRSIPVATATVSLPSSPDSDSDSDSESDSDDLPPVPTSSTTAYPHTTPQTRLLFTTPFVELLAVGLIWGISVGIIENFLTLYLEELGAPPLLWGGIVTVMCAAEIPMFQYFETVVSKKGVLWIYQLVLAAFATRLAWYASLGPAPYGLPYLTVLPAELLHGITFACAWSIGSRVASRSAPPGKETTCQALFQATYFGFGNGLGGLVGGLVYQAYGARVLFAGGMVFVLVGWGGLRGYMRYKGDADVPYAYQPAAHGKGGGGGGGGGGEYQAGDQAGEVELGYLGDEHRRLMPSSS